MDPWATQVFVEYFCKNVCKKIPLDLSLWGRPAKVLNISSAIGWADPNLVKALQVLLDTSGRRSAIDWEDLKPYWNLEKRPHFFMWLTNLLFGSFSNILPSTERRLAGQLWFLAVDLFPSFSYTWTTYETF